MEHKRPLESISDDELLRRLAELLRQSRRAEADLVAHVAEVDERRLYAREASPSMFAYCTEVLHLSEAEAYLRIAAARASREHPMLLTMLADGRLHLTGIAKLAPHLTRQNRAALLERATHRSKRQIEELIAELAPRPDAPMLTRKLPERRNMASPPTAPAFGPVATTPATAVRLDGAASSERTTRRDGAVVNEFELRPDAVGPAAPELTVASTPASLVRPLSPGRYKVQFTASAKLHDKLKRLQSLMRSQVPDGDLAEIIEQAVTEKLERIEARLFATTGAPRKRLSETATSPSSRHIPAAVRRAVRERDGNRCRYVDEQGRRCPETDRLEYHHRRPFGLGGDHCASNTSLLCHGHNQYLADHDYGRKAMARQRCPENRASAATAVRS